MYIGGLNCILQMYALWYLSYAMCDLICICENTNFFLFLRYMGKYGTVPMNRGFA